MYACKRGRSISRVFFFPHLTISIIQISTHPRMHLFFTLSSFRKKPNESAFDAFFNCVCLSMRKRGEGVMVGCAAWSLS